MRRLPFLDRPRRRVIRVLHYPHGRRLYVGGFRVHHGLVGLAALIGGAIALAHDFRDFPWIDRPNH